MCHVQPSQGLHGTSALRLYLFLKPEVPPTRTFPSSLSLPFPSGTLISSLNSHERLNIKQPQLSALPKLQPCPGAPQPLAPGAWPGLGPASGVPEKTLFLSPCFLDPPLHTCYLLVLHTGALPTAPSPLSPLPSLHSRHEHLLADGPAPFKSSSGHPYPLRSSLTTFPSWFSCLAALTAS